MELIEQSSSKAITFVIPCYNEEENLPRLLNQLNDYLILHNDSKFIIVNNGSTDKSREILESQSLTENLAVIQLDVNRGYGGGIWAGVTQSKTAWTGWFHADLQIPLDDIVQVKSLALKEQHAAKGVRLGRPITDRIFTAGMSTFCSILFLTKLRDINGQPSIYETQFLQNIPNPPSDFSLDLYCYVMARKSGVHIHRQNVPMHQRTAGESSWNTGFSSRVRMISRTIKYAVAMRMAKKND
jgi:glycosyltransferase involved in cell wall biosynthesis